MIVADHLALPLRSNGSELLSTELKLMAGQIKEVELAFEVPAKGDVFTISMCNASRDILTLASFEGTDKVKVVGSPQSVTGKLGKALKFDGKNDYLKIDSINLKNRPFSLSAWIKIDCLSQPHQECPLFSGGQYETSKGMHIGIRMKKSFMGYYGNDLYGSGKLPLNEWVFVAYVQQAVFHEAQTGPDSGIAEDSLIKAHWSAKKQIYVNGKLDSTHDCDPYLSSIDYIGSFWGDSKFNGLLDDVRIYGKALTADEVKELNNDQNSVKDDILFWMSFD